METPTLNALRLQARLTMSHSASKVATAMCALSAEIRAESDVITTRWGAAIEQAFATAAEMQRQRHPQTPAAMMKVFHAVHVFMRNGLPRMEASTHRFRRRIDALRRAARRLSIAIRTAVVSLGCTRTAHPRPVAKRLDDLGIEVRDSELADDTSAPAPPATRQNDRAFVARMADLLEEKTKRTVTAEEKKRAVAVCKRQHTELGSQLRGWTSMAASADAWAEKIAATATHSAAIVQTARESDAFLNRANVVYQAK